jgi:ubiquinone/menaquinone biosynthesis C-methylase UbiE
VPPGPVDVLEVGGGKGNAIVGIHEYFQRGNDPDHELSLSMTSLTKLPEHTKLKEQGVRVYTGVLAEAMPAVWAGRFDIVYTDSVLGWTKIRYAIPELFRVLKSGGIWYGFEDSIDIIPRMQSVPELVLRELDELGIRNELTLENIRSMRTIVPRVYPFMCRKP